MIRADKKIILQCYAWHIYEMHYISNNNHKKNILSSNLGHVWTRFEGRALSGWLTNRKHEEWHLPEYTYGNNTYYNEGGWIECRKKEAGVGAVEQVLQAHAACRRKDVPFLNHIPSIIPNPKHGKHQLLEYSRCFHKSGKETKNKQNLNISNI